MTRRRPVRPTSYVTRIPDRRTWQEILDAYRDGKIPRLGQTPQPASPDQRSTDLTGVADDSRAKNGYRR